MPRDAKKQNRNQSHSTSRKNRERKNKNEGMMDRDKGDKGDMFGF